MLLLATYTVFVSDDNSCMDSLQITVPEIGGPTVTDSVIDITCYGDSTGIIYISTLGARSIYIFLVWTSRIY